MRRTGHLFEKMTDIRVIKGSILLAAKGKMNHRNVRRIVNNLDKYALRLQKMLMDGTFEPSPYKLKEINDGIRLKKRTIAKPRFYPDQCLHHVLIHTLEPTLMRGMYHYSCGSVPGRGERRAHEGIVKQIKRRPKKSKYVLKMDIHHFYDTVSHESLIEALKRKIKDSRILAVCEKIIRSFHKGVPIGNFTSPWFTNLLLEPLDHAIKAFIGKGQGYYRYVDDMIVIGSNKRRLYRLRQMIEIWLHGIGLRLKGNYQVYRLDKRCIDFIGVKYFKDGHTEIRKSIMKRIKRKAKRLSKLPYISFRNAVGMMSYMGYVHNTDSEYFFRKHIKPYIGSTRKLRRIIANEAKILTASRGYVLGSA